MMIILIIFLLIVVKLFSVLSYYDSFVWLCKTVAFNQHFILFSICERKVVSNSQKY